MSKSTKKLASKDANLNQDVYTKSSIWRTILLVKGPESGFTTGYRNGVSEEEFLASANKLLTK